MLGVVRIDDHVMSREKGRKVTIRMSEERGSGRGRKVDELSRLDAATHSHIHI